MVVGIEESVVLIAPTVAWIPSAISTLMLGVGFGVGGGSVLSDVAWT